MKGLRKYADSFKVIFCIPTRIRCRTIPEHGGSTPFRNVCTHTRPSYVTLQSTTIPNIAQAACLIYKSNSMCVPCNRNSTAFLQGSHSSPARPSDDKMTKPRFDPRSFRPGYEAKLCYSSEFCGVRLKR